MDIADTIMNLKKDGSGIGEKQTAIIIITNVWITQTAKLFRIMNLENVFEPLTLFLNRFIVSIRVPFKKNSIHS